MASKRIAQEYALLQREPFDMCSAGPTGDANDRHWVGTVAGPPETPYALGTFSVSIDFPEDYPRDALQFAMTTPILHPNISPEGKIHLPELEKDHWTPAFTVRTILVCLQAMLSDPDPTIGVLNEEAASLYLKSLEEFKQKVTQWTASYAISQEKDLASNEK